MTETTTTTTTPCPVCDAGVRVPADALVGEVLPCDDCGAELEVIGLRPATLGEAPEIAEDWGE